MWFQGVCFAMYNFLYQFASEVYNYVSRALHEHCTSAARTLHEHFTSTSRVLHEHFTGALEKMHDRMNQILELLESGEKKTAHIAEALEIPVYSVRKLLKILVDAKKVQDVSRGVYNLHEDYKPLSPLENRKIVKDLILFQKDLLAIYRKDLNHLLQHPVPDNDEKRRLLECIKVLSLSIDRLLKRWNLINQGYDANTRQAHEDAKRQAVDRDKQEQANAPLEDQLMEVGHFHSSLKELWDNLPESEKKSKTV